MTAKKRKMTPSFRVIDGELKMLKGKSWVTLTNKEANDFFGRAFSKLNQKEKDLQDPPLDAPAALQGENLVVKETAYSRSGNSALLINISSNHFSQLNTLCGLFDNLSEKAKLIPKEDVSKEAWEQGKSCYELMNGILEGHANITEVLEAQSVIVQKMAILLELEQITSF